jgi:hypothetical protein
MSIPKILVRRQPCRNGSLISWSLSPNHHIKFDTQEPQTLYRLLFFHLLVRWIFLPFRDQSFLGHKFPTISRPWNANLISPTFSRFPDHLGSLVPGLEYMYSQTQSIHSININNPWTRQLSIFHYMRCHSRVEFGKVFSKIYVSV